MGKKAKPSKISSNEAIAKSTSLRVSPRKLGLIASFIQNMKVSEAVAQLTFVKKRIAGEVKKCLQSAIANAENNHNLDIDKLYIYRAVVGKSVVMKRMHARARGRANRIHKYFSNLSIIVREYEEK